MIITITGGTGLIGQRLTQFLVERGDEVRILSRSTHENDNPVLFLTYDYIDQAINGSDAVINLAGANLFDTRWTEAYKKTIYESRIGVTRSVVESIGRVTHKPKVLVSGSAVGYYGNDQAEPTTESGSPGSDFLAQICVDWENEAKKVDDSVRLVLARTGIVLDKEGGALQQMYWPFFFGVGGPIGDGSQHFPWIHYRDMVRSLAFFVDNESAEGSFNLAAPEAQTMRQFCDVLGSVMHRPAFFTVPTFVLKLAFGQAAEAIVADMNIRPSALEKIGFKFDFTELDAALKDLLT